MPIPGHHHPVQPLSLIPGRVPELICSKLKNKKKHLVLGGVTDAPETWLLGNNLFFGPRL